MGIFSYLCQKQMESVSITYFSRNESLGWLGGGIQMICIFIIIRFGLLADLGFLNCLSLLYITFIISKKKIAKKRIEGQLKACPQCCCT